MVRHGTRRPTEKCCCRVLFVFNSEVSNAEQFMKRLLMIGCAVFMLAIGVSGQTAGPQSTNPSATSVSSQRALLDQYCVSCHNQKQKNAGLALDKLDLERVGENAEAW